MNLGDLNKGYETNKKLELISEEADSKIMKSYLSKNLLFKEKCVCLL